MKFKALILIVPLAFMLSACGKKSDTTDPAPLSGASASAGLGGAPSGAPSATPAPTPIPGPSGISGSSGGMNAQGCPVNPLRANPYAYYETGTGTGTVYTVANDIIADSKLRVSIVPTSAGGTSGTGGTMNYTIMAATVTLIKNGAEIASVDIPGNSGGSYYTTGVSVGKTSDPSLTDFSSYVAGASATDRFSIKVSNVRTDYKCNTFCTAQYYGCFSAQYYGGYCPYGYAANWDYHTWSQVCCPGSVDILDQCQRQQCGVGSMPNTGSWSLTVKVETDITGCI